jgi:hypothetical protein
MAAQRGEAARPPKPVDQPRAGDRQRPRAVAEHVALEEMAGEVEALGDFLPRRASAGTDECGQRQQLAGIRLGLGGADRAPRPRANRDQIVVGAADRAAFEVEPEAQLGEQEQLIAHQRASPAARRRRGLDRVEQPAERVVQSRKGLRFGQGGRGQHRRPLDRRRRQRL